MKITRPTWFVILSMSRSGSWHLVELLNEHPKVVCNGEILNNDDTSGWPGGDRSNLTDRQLVAMGLEAPPLRGAKEGQHATGFKMLEEQLSSRPQTLDFLSRAVKVSAIVLERRNQFEALRSLAQAKTTGAWQDVEGTIPNARGPRVLLDPAECLDRFRIASEFYTLVGETFPMEQRLWIYYEDLLEDRSRVLSMIWKFLNVREHQSIERLRRQEKRPLAATVTNYAELCKFFNGRPELALLKGCK